MIKFAIMHLYCGGYNKQGYYNSQPIGLSRALKKRGYDCYYFIPDFEIGEIKEEKVEDYIMIVRIPAKKLGGHSIYDYRVLLKYGIQAVLIESDTQITVPTIMKFCRKNHIQAYNYIGAIESDTNNPLKKALLSVLYYRNVLVYRKSKCFAKTEMIKKKLLAKGIKDVTLAPVGLDFSVIPDIKENQREIKERLNIPLEKKVLLFVGKLEEYKNPQDMLSVVKSLGEEYYGILIGQGSMYDELNRQIELLGISDRVRMVGRILNTEIHQYYVASDYLLNFNSKEIFGMALLEAMYQGVTVIAVKAPGPEQIIEDQKTGFLVDNKEQMMEIVQKDVILDSEAVREYTVERLSWDMTAGIVDECIRR